MAERESTFDEAYADLGEHPPAGVPGVIGIETPGLTQAAFEETATSGTGRVADAIRRLHESGRAVAADWTPGKVTLWVSTHKKTIEASAAASAVLATGATLYLLRKRAKEGQLKKP